MSDAAFDNNGSIWTQEYSLKNTMSVQLFWQKRAIPMTREYLKNQKKSLTTVFVLTIYVYTTPCLPFVLLLPKTSGCPAFTLWRSILWSSVRSDRGAVGFHKGPFLHNAGV